MIAALLWLIFSWLPAPDAAEVARDAGHLCPYGCIVGSRGWSYEVTREDILWIAKVAKAESGPRFVEDETAATVWALVQGYYARASARGDRDLSLAGFIQNYSAACSKRWATGGERYHARITPRADKNRALRWADIPERWREFTGRFLRAKVPLRVPGLIHVLARGFERFARDDLIGPYYATTEDEHPGGNAFYATDQTMFWTPSTVRIVPARINPWWFLRRDALADLDALGE